MTKFVDWLMILIVTSADLLIVLSMFLLLRQFSFLKTIFIIFIKPTQAELGFPKPHNTSLLWKTLLLRSNRTWFKIFARIAGPQNGQAGRQLSSLLSMVYVWFQFLRHTVLCKARGAGSVLWL